MSNPYTKRIRAKGWLPQKGESLAQFFERRNAELDAERDSQRERGDG